MSQPPQTPPAIEVLLSADAIAVRISQLAREIATSQPADLLVVPILKGSFVFAADLIRGLHDNGLNPEIDFLMLSSYGASMVSQGHIDVVRDIDARAMGRNVLLIDDILESGRTLAHAKGLIQSRKARQVATCVLLNKPVPRAVPIKPEFTGFECPNTFVVGYGMDFENRYRELPFIGRIVQESN